MTTNTNEVKQWDGKIHIISDEKFFAMLTDQEYQLFCALKVIARHDFKGNSYIEIPFFSDINISELAEELALQGRIEGTTVQRKTLAITFKNLIDKGILTRRWIKDQDQEVYYLINENIELYKWTKIDAELLEGMTKCLRGQVIKAYVYIKANFEYNLKNDNKTFFKRETIAKAINEINKKGEIKKGQLDNITHYMTFLYNLGLIKACIHKRKVGKIYSSLLEVTAVSDKLKKIPKAK